MLLKKNQRGAEPREGAAVCSTMTTVETHVARPETAEALAHDGRPLMKKRVHTCACERRMPRYTWNMTAVENPGSLIRSGTIWPMSVEAYHVLGEAGLIPENTELLYGIVYKKMPISPYHEYLLLWLVEKMYEDLA